MKKNIFKLLMTTGFLITAIALTSTTAYAMADLSVVGTLTNDTTTATSNSALWSYSGGSGTGMSGGFYAGLHIPGGLGLRTGLLYAQRKLNVKLSVLNFAVSQTATLSSLQVPALITYKVIPMLTVFGGMMFNFGQSNISVDQNDPNNLNGGSFSGKSMTYSQYNTPTSDNAIELGLDFALPVSPTMNVLIGGDYQMGNTNMDTSGNNTIKVNVLEAFAGLQFTF